MVWRMLGHASCHDAIELEPSTIKMVTLTLEVKCCSHSTFWGRVEAFSFGRGPFRCDRSTAAAQAWCKRLSCSAIHYINATNICVYIYGISDKLQRKTNSTAIRFWNKGLPSHRLKSNPRRLMPVTLWICPYDIKLWTRATHHELGVRFIKSYNR